MVSHAGPYQHPINPICFDGSSSMVTSTLRQFLIDGIKELPIWRMALFAVSPIVAVAVFLGYDEPVRQWIGGLPTPQEQLEIALIQADCGDNVAIHSRDGILTATKSIQSFPEACTRDVSVSYWTEARPADEATEGNLVLLSVTERVNRPMCRFNSTFFQVRQIDPDTREFIVAEAIQILHGQLNVSDGAQHFRSELLVPRAIDLSRSYEIDFALSWFCPEGNITDTHRDPEGRPVWFPVLVDS